LASIRFIGIRDRKSAFSCTRPGRYCTVNFILTTLWLNAKVNPFHPYVFAITEGVFDH
jgi:hypothetical protein